MGKVEKSLKKCRAVHYTMIRYKKIVAYRLSDYVSLLLLLLLLLWRRILHRQSVLIMFRRLSCHATSGIFCSLYFFLAANVFDLFFAF